MAKDKRITKLKLNKIYNSDAIKFMQRLPENSIDLIITDPPYNLGFDYGKYKDNLTNEEYFKWCSKWLRYCYRILKENGSIYVIHYPEQASRLMILMSDLGLQFQNWITWHYNSNIGVSPKNFTRSQRTILFFTKSSRFKFNLKEGEIVLDYLEYQLVKNVSKEKIEGSPNQIPLKLISLLIDLSSNKNDIVFDPFIGSGTTAVASANLKRKYLGCDQNLDYVKIAYERIKRGY